MRALAILAAALVASAAVSGCIGGLKESDDPVDQTNLPPGTTGNTGTPGTPGAVTVRNPLLAQVTLDAPAWIESGTEVPVSLSSPANAKGDVKYAWAIGALPGTVDVTAYKADTGSGKLADYIQPGATKSITYGVAGTFRMHCHPHPDMLHNVTVIEGYQSPKTVDVLIVDGGSLADYRFVPENLVIGVNTTVNYKNVGAQPHTATAMGAQEPALKLLPLDAASGTIKVDGEGWQRIVAVFQDSEGRLGLAESRIYATAKLPEFATQTETFEFPAAAPLPSGAPQVVGAPESRAVKLAHPGQVTLKVAFEDTTTLGEIELHFTKDGETQDTITGDKLEDELTAKALAGGYTLRIVPVQGAQLSGTVTIDVVYDLVPPEPTAPKADDGHGDHGAGGHH